MAAPNYSTTQLDAEHFVESAGAILIHVTKRQICLVYDPQRKVWLLPKGRRNAGEHRAAAACREVTEETGYDCELLPLTMNTRAPPAVEQEPFYPDEPRRHEKVTEPFMLSYRKLDGEANVKLIWWFIAAIKGSAEPDRDIKRGPAEETYEARLFEFGDAVNALTFQTDRDVVRKAIEIFEANQTGHSSHI